MIADYFTKPLQGALFEKMRDIIMGLIIFPDEERVNLGEFVGGVSIKNNKISPVECGSIDNAEVINNNGTGIKDGMTDKSDVYAGSMRMPSYSETVRGKHR